MKVAVTAETDPGEPRVAATPETVKKIAYSLMSQEESKAFEAEHTRPANRREKNDARAALKQQLRQKLSPKVKTFDVSWNLKTQELQVWAASRKTVEEIESALEKTFGIKVLALAPTTAAAALGIQEEALTPTPDLSWPDFEADAVAMKSEVADG